MSNIYEKIAGDNTLVLTPRDGFMRKFNFGTWTDMAIGMFYTGIIGDNSAISASEFVALATNADRITFGIKNSSNTILPGFSGSYFLGTCTGQSDAQATSFTNSYGNPGALLFATGYNGTASLGGTTNYGLSNIAFPTGGGTGATSYNGFNGVRFTITNRGQSNQTVYMRYGRTDDISGTDYSTAALITQINNQTWNNSTGGTNYQIDWNDGVSAYPIPDAFWVRMPFYGNSIRMSSVAAVKFS